jgi:hypothetical protein
MKLLIDITIIQESRCGYSHVMKTHYCGMNPKICVRLIDAEQALAWLRGVSVDFDQYRMGTIGWYEMTSLEDMEMTSGQIYSLIRKPLPNP